MISWPRTVVVVSLVGVLLGGCGIGGGVQEVRLERLADEQDAWDGRDVRTRGIVRMAEQPLHYWIEDDVPNRVEIQPADAVEDHVGRQVIVEGTFRFRDDEGRRITVGTVEVVTPDS
ncbi:Menaquinone via futalosine polyprenyltransferase [Euzebya pacifica]|uniref:Menaquinone via futalosine polyprenyltransferase n=1 Tax=Euzebya pacifica TaxID=1608957 RepID=A0A346XRH2_9ACTN|nr:hypothetical protein [Euzebya pacifica]AXV04819.1 Menaquinone via futalosine polyprenyltransferase [Euzebya pacifica]